MNFCGDFFGGVMVGIVVLLLVFGFGVVLGMENGVVVGFYGVIVVGFFVFFFGGMFM